MPSLRECIALVENLILPTAQEVTNVLQQTTSNYLKTNAGPCGPKDASDINFGDCAYWAEDAVEDLIHSFPGIQVRTYSSDELLAAMGYAETGDYHEMIEVLTKSGKLYFDAVDVEGNPNPSTNHMMQHCIRSARRRDADD